LQDRALLIIALRKGLMGAYLCCTLVWLTTAQPTWAQATEDEANVSIEALLKGGWQIAGYASAVDNWSAFILFRHPDQPYLVQCKAGYDVLREPRIQPHCYKLR
jgi:hypothetical protein